jgi:hypothetical protein
MYLIGANKHSPTALLGTGFMLLFNKKAAFGNNHVMAGIAFGNIIGVLQFA